MTVKKNKNEIVSGTLQNPINYKIILAMAAGFSLFQIFITNTTNQNFVDDLVEAISIMFSGAAGIMPLCLALTKYKNASLGKNFFLFSLAFLFTAIGEITFAIYDELGLDPFPSLADVFFIMYYPFLFLFIYRHYKLFPAEKQNGHIKDFLFVGAIAGAIAIMGFVQWSTIHLDFYDLSATYGYVVQSLDVVIFGLVLKTMLRHKGGLLTNVWLLLLYGVLSISIADMWYYVTEVLGQYTLTHPLNLFYYFGYSLIVYVAIKHRQIL